MLDWLTHDGQASAASDGYVPLPSQVQQLARTVLQQVTGPSGAHLLGCPGTITTATAADCPSHAEHLKIQTMTVRT